MFKMEGYVIDEIKYFDDEIQIKCHVRAKRMGFKDEYSNKVTETKVRKIHHMMLEDKPVILLVKQRRFKFKKYGKRWEPLPQVKGKSRTSREFKKNTLRELQRDNYSGTGKKRGKSGMYAMKLLDNLDFDLQWPETMTKLGLDGKYVRTNKLVHNITNLSDKEVSTVLPNLSQAELKKFSKQPHKRTKRSN